MLLSHYRPSNECVMPQYHFVAYAYGLGPSRLVHDAEIAMKCCVIHEGAPNFPYHRLDCHIVMIVPSTAYQWMAGEIPCIDGIRGWLGAANAGD